MEAEISLIYPQLKWQGREIEPDIRGPELSLGPRDPWFCIGSCFAERSARALKQHLLDVHFGAGGALYTAESIRQWLRLCRLVDQGPLRFADEAEGLLSSFPFGRSAPGATAERFLHPYTPGWLEGCSRREFLHCLWRQCQMDNEFLRRSRMVLLTLGSSFSFYSAEQDCYWSNGHRLPAAGSQAYLSRKLFSVNQIEVAFEEVLALLSELSPLSKVICSVSPLRHDPLPAVDNSLSKAQLLTVVHGLRRSSRLSYFPAYEIVMDELRDYRWYDAQRKQLRVESFALLLQRLLQAVAGPELKGYLAQVRELALLLRHRSPAKRLRLWTPQDLVQDSVQSSVQNSESGPAAEESGARSFLNQERSEQKAEQRLVQLRARYPELQLPASAAAYRHLLANYSLDNEYY